MKNIMRCPKCETLYDVTPYTHGTRVQCRRCGLKFVIGETHGRETDSRTPVRAARPRPPDPLLSGIVRGDYQIQELIGEGALGRVYRAIYVPSGRVVAAKAPAADLWQDSTFRGRFQEACVNLKGLIHPNIVTVEDSGPGDDPPLLVMEFVRDQTLRQSMDRGDKWSVKERLVMLLQVGRGVEHAHSLKISHRDLKVENVFVAAGPTCRVTDFGLADCFDGAALDPRADTYAFAVMIFELLNENLPLSDGYELRADVPERLNRVLTRFFDGSRVGLAQLLDELERASAEPR